MSLPHSGGRARGRADLHLHPTGDRSAREASPDAFLAAIAASGLDVAVLTDHDRIDVACDLAAEAVDRGLGVEVVAGEEVSTRDGHLLALGVRSLVPPHRPLGDTVAAVHDQGGLAVVAHPMLPTKISVRKRLLEDLADGLPDRRPDAVEGFNPMAAWLPFYTRRVAALARKHRYPIVGGSDGHLTRHVARGQTIFRGRTFEDLRRAIGAGEVEGRGRPFDPPDLVVGIIGQFVEGTVRPGRG